MQHNTSNELVADYTDKDNLTNMKQGEGLKLEIGMYGLSPFVLLDEPPICESCCLSLAILTAVHG